MTLLLFPLLRRYFNFLSKTLECFFFMKEGACDILRVPWRISPNKELVLSLAHTGFLGLILHFMSGSGHQVFRAPPYLLVSLSTLPCGMSASWCFPLLSCQTRLEVIKGCCPHSVLPSLLFATKVCPEKHRRQT